MRVKKDTTRERFFSSATLVGTFIERSLLPCVQEPVGSGERCPVSLCLEQFSSIQVKTFPRPLPVALFSRRFSDLKRQHHFKQRGCSSPRDERPIKALEKRRRYRSWCSRLPNERFIIPPAPPTVSVRPAAADEDARRREWKFTDCSSSSSGRSLPALSIYELGSTDAAAHARCRTLDPQLLSLYSFTPRRHPSVISTPWRVPAQWFHRNMC